MSAELKEPERRAEPDDGVDVTLIRWMLSLTAEERLAVLEDFLGSIAAMTDGATRS